MSEEHDEDAQPIEPSFSEKSFYLAEFRGRTLAMALADDRPEALAPLETVLGDLAENATRVVMLAEDRALLETLLGDAVVSAADPTWLGALWRGMRQHGRVGLALSGGGNFAAACRDVALRLRIAKLVWIDRRGALERPDGTRLSLVDLDELDRWLAAAPAPPNADRFDVLREIREMLAGGVPAVNWCDANGLSDELFTYAGSGTFFARERYIEVRRLGFDEFDAAELLIRRGVDEGYLVERSAEALEEILSNAFGVFVEGRYLAGIAALLPHPGRKTAEIASLYTLTRFLGEGIGSHLVRFALEHARAREIESVFACTTSERVEAFFRRHGFGSAERSELPAGKWSGYAPDRLERVRCLKCVAS